MPAVMIFTRSLSIGKAPDGETVLRQFLLKDLTIAIVVFDEQDADGTRRLGPGMIQRLQRAFG